jgi:hypothetical protein
MALAMAVLALLGTENAQAEVVASSGPVQIVGMTTYSTFGGGDVVFEISVPITGCGGGIWIRATDPGFQQNVAAVLSARMANRPVTLYVENSDIWTGSASSYCRFYGMSF